MKTQDVVWVAIAGEDFQLKKKNYVECLLIALLDRQRNLLGRQIKKWKSTAHKMWEIMIRAR
jgi:hypothetical protein